MFKRNSLYALVICLFSSLALLAQSSTVADVDNHKAEVGILFTHTQVDGVSGGSVNGVGGRFGYNLNKHFAIDTEFNFFPETKFGNDATGQKTQAFAGVKAGVRSGRVGGFLKARPGVMFIGEVTSGFNCSGSSALGTTCRPSHNNLALDLGGVLELYPSKRSIVRFDAGDTIVRIKRTTLGLLLPSTTTTNTTSNFQVSVGVGFRF